MKTTKYRSVKTEVDGITFHSKKEANYYGKLKLLKRAGEVINIDLQPPYEFLICYINPATGQKSYHDGKYIADFRVTYKDGSVEIIDVKGFSTDVFRRKQRIMKEIFGIEIKVV